MNSPVFSSRGRDVKIEPIDEKDKFGAKMQLRSIIKEKYEMVSIIGKGSYGCVSKAKCKSTGKYVAIKIFNNHSNSEYDTIKLVREILISKRLNEIQKKLGLSKEHGFVPELYDALYT